MEIETPPRNIQQAYNTMDEYHNWLLMNDKFIVKSVGKETAEIQGDKTLLTYHLKISDLTPKSEVFKVRVVKCTVDLRWYAQKIGQTFSVINHPNNSEAYRIVKEDGTHEELLILFKSDCIVVTDQKFKVGDRVNHWHQGKGLIVKVEEKDRVPFKVQLDSDQIVWATEDELTIEQPAPATSLPFTEELFNQGKYEVYHHGEKIESAHIFDGRIWGEVGMGVSRVISFNHLTLKEKEVVVYIVPTAGFLFESKEVAIGSAKVRNQPVFSWNETTRTVSKVWDFFN